MKIFFVAFAALCALVTAQTTCDGELAGEPITNDVSVPDGASCILSANVTGSITVGKSSSFSTSGTLQVDGGLSASESAAINLGGTLSILGGVEVLGATELKVAESVFVSSFSVKDVPDVTIDGMATTVHVTNSDSLTIGSEFSPGTVSVDEVDKFVFKGNASSISVKGTGDVTLDAGSITGGGLLRTPGTGDVTLCGANVQGGIELTTVKGKLSIFPETECAVSTIRGTMKVVNGQGDIKIEKAGLDSADFLVSNRVGSIILTEISPSDVSISNLEGPLTMESVVADSDTTLVNVEGDIVLKDFETEGDFSIEGPGSAVTVSDSDFGLEDVSVKGAEGVVTFSNNENIGLTLEENDEVIIVGNTGTDVLLSKNGPVTFKDNTFESVVCTENESVDGAGNEIGFGDGQCASGLA